MIIDIFHYTCSITFCYMKVYQENYSISIDNETESIPFVWYLTFDKEDMYEQYV